MRWITGTAVSDGQIKGNLTETRVFSIEFYAPSTNVGNPRVGASNISGSLGRRIEPTDTHTPNFLGEDGTTRSIAFSEIYVVLSGANELDWSAQVED